ncbi:MAG: hypothetical protein OJF52_001430 [Nitrospira sp.]|nr:MAG: hypothetical protein OJF52_001430 [Nitrospira sp.]
MRDHVTAHCCAKVMGTAGVRDRQDCGGRHGNKELGGEAQ